MLTLTPGAVRLIELEKIWAQAAPARLEPSALDAGRRAALYDEITALGAQAWMTGTGPELFDSLGDRAPYVDVTEDDGLSNVARQP